MASIYGITLKVTRLNSPAWVARGETFTPYQYKEMGSRYWKPRKEMVELEGLEPSTSSLPRKRAPSAPQPHLYMSII